MPPKAIPRSSAGKKIRFMLTPASGRSSSGVPLSPRYEYGDLLCLRLEFFDDFMGDFNIGTKNIFFS